MSDDYRRFWGTIRIEWDVNDRMPEISVIIPCYNAEKTIIKALQSLARQSFRDFEVVIVDDGSQDHSAHRIREYAKVSSLDILLIRQENGGVSYARNVGMRHACGTFISFLDADDAYTPDFLESLYLEIRKNNADIAFCKYTFTDLEDRRLKNVQYQTKKVSKCDMLHIFLHKRTEQVNFVGGLYRNSVIKQHSICFPAGIRYGEDSQFFCTYIFYCEQSGVYIEKAMYRYLLQETSATKKVSYDKVQNIEAYNNIVSLWKKDKNFSEKTGEILIARSLWALAKDFAIQKREYFERLQEEYNVKDAMRVMKREGDEYSIRLSSRLFLLHPLLFLFLVRLYTAIR